MQLRKLGPNRMELARADGVTVLVSYATPVAAFVPGVGYLRTDRRYSATTSRHIAAWLPTKPANVPAVNPATLAALAEGAPYEDGHG